jgi:hypothetical protein
MIRLLEPGLDHHASLPSTYNVQFRSANLFQNLQNDYINFGLQVDHI